ncbi:uncharacterized protein LOC131650960 [Vicia villosa]|uniref:uncharacterized protein LOC131650960 n=1 Tax=Vicia villosa TaxID=3911 RepID=UPI00273B3C75|nr:uncharacterized protein LOC131650960 [Vicia villosa]
MSCFDDSAALSFWGNKEVAWSASHSRGASGGMVILWDKSLSVNFSFMDKGYIGINLSWKGGVYNIVNIYASCNAADRRALWSSLLDRRLRSVGEEWCLGGDFNEVSCREERKGERVCHSSRNMEDFRRFIELMDLVDIPCIGGRFTWYKDNGKSMSRLDRFLVSNKVIDDWNIIDQRVGARDVSDHCHIWLNVGKLDWGPKPFRFNNAWFAHEGFLKFLEEEWAKIQVNGSGEFILYEKLKRMKVCIRKWNREVFGWIDLCVEEKVESLNNLDNLLAEHHGEDISRLVDDRFNVTSDLWKSLSLKESMLRLKSRQLWLKDGDRNSEFFHKSLKERRRITIDGALVVTSILFLLRTKELELLIEEIATT